MSLKHNTCNCDNENVLKCRDEMSYFIYDLIHIEQFCCWVSKKDDKLLKMAMFHVCDGETFLDEKVFEYICSQKNLQKNCKYYGLKVTIDGNILAKYSSELKSGEFEETNYIPIPYPFDLYYKSKIRKDSKKLPHMIYMPTPNKL